MNTFIPSAYQQAIFDFVKTGSGNAVVSAVAGSGKTSTLVEAMQDFIVLSVGRLIVGAKLHVKAKVKDCTEFNGVKETTLIGIV